MSTVRFEVFFSGTVQGVGFRYTTLRVARDFDVVGTVQNLPDRRVKMVVEGTPDTIEQFIHAVCESMRGNVSGTETHRFPATHEFSGFQIVH